MKLNRLVEILIKLLNKRMVTAGELSEYFGVSVRTIYRDIDVLCTCGIPIYTTQGYNGGISLMEDYTVSKTFLTKEEKNNILFSLKALQATKYPGIDASLEKLSSIFKVDNTGWIDIDFTPWGLEPGSENQLADIKYAVLNHFAVSFDYINSGNVKSQRKIEPIQLRYRYRYWYLWGWDLEKNDFRMFKLSRIRNFTVTDEHFDHTEKRICEQENKESDSKRPQIELELLFQPEALYRLYDDYEDDYIKQNSDRTFTLHISLPEDDWLYGYILSFGPNVKVIEPKALKEKIIGKIQKMNQVYN